MAKIFFSLLFILYTGPLTAEVLISSTDHVYINSWANLVAKLLDSKLNLIGIDIIPEVIAISGNKLSLYSFDDSGDYYVRSDYNRDTGIESTLDCEGGIIQKKLGPISISQTEKALTVTISGENPLILKKASTHTKKKLVKKIKTFYRDCNGAYDTLEDLFY